MEHERFAEYGFSNAISPGYFDDHKKCDRQLIFGNKFAHPHQSLLRGCWSPPPFANWVSCIRLDLNLRSVTNQTLFIYHYVEARSLVLRYNYTSQDGDPGQPYFVMRSTLAGSLMLTGQISSSFVCCFFPACICHNLCLIGAWNLCTTRILRDWNSLFPPDGIVRMKALNIHEDEVWHKPSFFQSEKEKNQLDIWRQWPNKEEKSNSSKNVWVETQSILFWSTLSTCSVGLPVPSPKTFATGVKAL